MTGNELDLTLAEVADALARIPPDDRDTWVRMAFALKAEFGDEGWEIWESWSAGYGRYDAAAARDVWKSARRAGRKGTVGLGSLIQEAERWGWVPPQVQLSDEERQRREREAQERRRAAREKAAHVERLLVAAHETLAEAAQVVWDKLLSGEGESEYLTAKQVVGAEGIRFCARPFVVVVRGDPDELVPVTWEAFAGGSQVNEFFRSSAPKEPHTSFRYVKPGGFAVPARDEAGRLVNLQFIYPSGKKKFLKAARKQGTSHLLGEAPPPGHEGIIALGEGYATCATVREAMSWPVWVCWDAGNLKVIAEQLRRRYPRAHLVIAGDDDREVRGNPGRTKAHAAAQAVGGTALVPEFTSASADSSDFNDLKALCGIEEVRRQLGALQAPSAAQCGAQRSFDGGMDAPEEPSPAPELAPEEERDWERRLQRTKEGAYKSHPGNLQIILTHDRTWAGALGYCDFSYRVIKHRAPLPHMKEGEWEDGDTARMRVWMAHTYGINPSTTDVLDAVLVVAQARRFHPVREYLRSRVWDGTSRLGTWLERALGATAHDTRYLAGAGLKFLVGAVARVENPGCKMDNVLILEGRQGARKSTALAVLFGEWFSDAPLALGDKDAYHSMQGVWCVEMAELDSFNKAESTTAKSFFSQRRDRFRPSYGRVAQDFPRQCVVCGSTNQEDYLRDYTGNRRYWPVSVHAIDIDWVREFRDQLWAEAVALYHAGTRWWVEEEERGWFEPEQEQRMQLDPWHYPIAKWLRETTFDFVTADEVISGALEKDIAQVQRADQNRLSPIMKALHWTKARRTVLIGAEKEQRHGYVRPPKTGAEP